jgi:uncharacterized protein
LICSDPALSRLDENLNMLYRRQLAAHPDDKDLLRAWQRQWLHGHHEVSGGMNVSFNGDYRRK